MIGNKLADEVAKLHDCRITNVSKPPQQNNLETVTNERNKEIHKQRYIYLEERQKIFDKLDINIIV